MTGDAPFTPLQRMPFPPALEIVPLPAAPRVEVSVPGSKSITNRALVLAALADGSCTLRGALWSEDTQVMVECLRALGFEVTVEPDANETCNRTIAVQGLSGQIPQGGSEDKPLELFVGNAGTAARFLAALVCLGRGAYRLQGVPRMHERPQAGLFQALRSLGYRVEAPLDKLPATIFGSGPRAGHCRVSIEKSSQFASALLLCSKRGGWSISIEGENADESPYVAMTEQLLRAFPNQGGTFQIEPDASSGSYFWAAGWLFQEQGNCPIHVANWPTSDWQIDARFPKYLPLPATISRSDDLADSIMTAMVLAPFGTSPTRFTDLGRLRVQECERVEALRTELSKCGARVREHGDTLDIFPSRLHGAEIETYNDHRVAMCFAVLGLKVAGIRIKNPSCVKKTFPDFFQKLAAPPPRGLGATLRDAASGAPLADADLIAT